MTLRKLHKLLYSYAYDIRTQQLEMSKDGPTGPGNEHLLCTVLVSKICRELKQELEGGES